MKAILRPNHLPTRIALILAAAMLASCIPPTSTPTAPPPPTATAPATLTPAPTLPPTVEVPTATSSPTDAPLPTNTASPQPTLSPVDGVLSQTGPWVLISTTAGLWAANEDGAGLTRLTDTAIVGPANLRKALSPDGRTLAFVSADSDRMHHLTLNLLTLPDGKVTPITPLTNAKTEPGPDLSTLDEKIEAARAITEHDSMAWSPDGSTLAFIGIQDGPSADLYTYVPATGKITRLSDGPSQAYAPTWSLDGRSILHFGVLGFGTGAGAVMAGVWAAQVSSGNIMTMLTGGGSGQEFAGWVDDHRFLINAWNPACGKNDLRLQDVNTAKTVSLEKGCFAGAAASPATGLILLGSGGTTGAGLRAIDPATLARRDILPDAVTAVEYRPDGWDFRVTTVSRDVIISNTGNVMAKAPPANCKYRLEMASYGALYGWTCAVGPDFGVWVNGPGVPDRKIFDQAASSPTWSPKNTLLFFSGQSLYRALFFDYQPEQMGAVEGDVLATAWLIR